MHAHKIGSHSSQSCTFTLLHCNVQGLSHAKCLQPHLEHLIHSALLARALLLLQRLQLRPQRAPLRILLRAVIGTTLSG